MARRELDLHEQRRELIAFFRLSWHSLSAEAAASLAPGGSIIAFHPHSQTRGNAGFTHVIDARVSALKAHLVSEMPAALRRLGVQDPQGARVLWLRYHDRQRTAETARLLGVSRQAVWRAEERALTWLARHLWSDDGSPMASQEASCR